MSRPIVTGNPATASTVSTQLRTAYDQLDAAARQKCRAAAGIRDDSLAALLTVGPERQAKWLAAAQAVLTPPAPQSSEAPTHE